MSVQKKSSYGKFPLLLTSRILCFVILLLFLSSCHNAAMSDHYFSTSFMNKGDINLSNKLFFIGPQIDTLKMDISADCDCCASNLAFVNDSIFVFESLCLEGDDYFKGTYYKFKNLIFLKFDPLSVSAIHYPGEDKATTWERVLDDSVSYSVLNFTTLKSEWVISASYGENTDYGMCNRSISVKRYLAHLEFLGVWSRLNLSHDLK